MRGTSKKKLRQISFQSLHSSDMVYSEIDNNLNETSLDSDVDVSSANLQQLQCKSTVSLPADAKHLSCCLLSRKICIVAETSLKVFDFTDNKISLTMTFERCLRHVACCETTRATQYNGATTQEWIAVADEEDDIFVLNVITGGKSFLKLEDNECEWQISQVNTLELSSSKINPHCIRMMICCESGDAFVSELYDPLQLGGMPTRENFVKINLRQERSKLMSFSVTFLDVDAGDILCASMKKDRTYLSIMNSLASEIDNMNSHQIVSESMYQDRNFHSKDILDGQLKVFVADDDDCKRAVMVCSDVVYIWNVETMCLERIWEAKDELMDAIKTRSDVVLFLKKGDKDSNNLSIELRSFPNMYLKRRLEVSEAAPKLFASCCLPPGFNTNHYELEENVYFLLGNTDLKLMALEQPDVASRILKLISRGDFEAAEKLAAAVGVDTSPALKAKLSYCVNYLNGLSKTVNNGKEFQEDLKYNKVLSELFQCLKLTFVSCDDLENLLILVLPNLDHTTQMLSAIRSKLDELENSPDCNLRKISALRNHLHNILHRLGTYVTVCCDFDARDWKHFSKSPARIMFMKFIKKGWLESAEVIWSRHRAEILSLDAHKLNDLVKMKVCNILSSIPKRVSSSSIIRFLKKIIIPEVIHQLESVHHIALWIQDRARQLELSEPHHWPQNAISLCQVFDSWENELNMDPLSDDVDRTLSFKELAAKMCHLSALATSSGADIDPLTKIQNLASTLLEVKDLKTKYGCPFSLSTLEVESVEAIAFRMLDRIVAVELMAQVVKDFIKPYLLDKNLNPDEVLFKYIEMKISADNAHVEKMVQIIRCIDSFASKCASMECLLKFAPTPWNDQLKSLVNELLSTEHPLANSIRERYFSASLEMMLFSYGFSRCQQHLISTERIMERIVNTDGEQCIEDCLKVAEHGKYSASDVFYLKADSLCSNGAVDGVVDLLDKVDSYATDFEDSSRIKEELSDRLIELGELNGFSRFSSKENSRRYRQNAINMLSLQLEKHEVANAKELISFDRNPCACESYKKRLSQNLQCHLEEFGYYKGKHELKDCSSQYDLVIQELHGSTTGLDMDLLTTLIESMAKSLPSRSVMDMERWLNKHRWVKMILKIYEASSNYVSKFSEDESELMSKLEMMFDSTGLTFTWSDISHAVRDLLCQSNILPVQEFVALADILLMKKHDQLSLQIYSIAFFESFCRSKRIEDASSMLGISTSEFSIVGAERGDGQELFNTIYDHLKTPVSNVIMKLFAALRCPDTVLSLLCSCYDEKQAINVLAKLYISNQGKPKKQKLVATVALAYHYLKNLHQEFFPILSLKSNWIYKLAQYQIAFNDSEKVESIPAMARCAPLNISYVFQFSKDFDLDLKEVCLLCLRTLLSSETFTNPVVLCRATVICRESYRFFESPEQLLKLLQSSLQTTDGKNYEKIEFILSRINEVECRFTSNSEHLQCVTTNKLNLLNFLKSYKPIKNSSHHNLNGNDQISFAPEKIRMEGIFCYSEKVESCRDKSNKRIDDRLSFHAFFTNEMWNVIKQELNQDSVDLWRSIAPVLKISEDNILITAMMKILNSALSLVERCGDEVSEETITLLINLNQSIASPSDAVKVCDTVIDSLPKNHLKQKLRLYELCESLSNVWMKSGGSDAAAKVYSNCLYNRKKLLATQIFFEKGFHDLLKMLEKDFVDGSVLHASHAEQLIERLCEHESIDDLWQRKKHFSLEDSRIYVAVEHLALLFELDLEKIQMDLLAKWMPSNLQIQQEVENISMVEGLEIESRDSNDVDEERRLLLSIHILCHMNTDKAITYLKAIILDDGRFSECRIRAMRCLLRLFSPSFAAIQLSYSRSQLITFVADLIAHAHLEKLGIFERVEECSSQVDKVNLLKTLTRFKSRGSSVIAPTLAASFAFSYEIFDVNILKSLIRILSDHEHFALLAALVYGLLRYFPKHIIHNTTLNWFQEVNVALFSKIMACGSSTKILCFQALSIFLAYPGCILMNKHHMIYVMDATSNLSQLDMEPCAYAIALMGKDFSEMDFGHFLSQDYKGLVSSRMEKWTGEGLVNPLRDQIIFSIKKGEAASQIVTSCDLNLTVTDSLDATHFEDLNATSDRYFCSQESFIQECQSILNISALNNTISQI